jgi:hypothetical protein
MGEAWASYLVLRDPLGWPISIRIWHYVRINKLAEYIVERVTLVPTTFPMTLFWNHRNWRGI